MSLLTRISSILPISKELEKSILAAARVIEVGQSEHILEQGKRCNQLYFVECGLLRGYYFDESKEITHWFAAEGEFATGFYSFTSKQPSYEFVQALEDCKLSAISYEALQELYTKFPETERLGRIITEAYYLKLEERLLNLHFKSAKERYSQLLQQNPKLLQRAPLGQIASWLGITQETLSRIRSES